MEVVSVQQSNMRIYLNLLQGYEAEFSAITHKLPNHMGLFDLDTELVGDTFGLLCYIEGKPVGFAAIKKTGSESYEVCEFYIIPAVRNQNLGELFAHRIWQEYRGEWLIKQIARADKATQFWRKAISSFNTSYIDSTVDDDYWGQVTQQSFSSKTDN